MSQDLVKALGVTISSAEYIAASLRCGAPIFTEYVSVPGLRAALENLPVVYGFSDSEGNRFNDTKFPSDTHSARLLAIEEIKREPLKHEFSFLVGSGICAIPEYFKGKTVKVTVEEIDGNGDPL